MTAGDLNTLIGAAGFLVTVIGLAFAGWRWAVGTLRASEAEARTEIAKLYALIETRSSEYDGRLAALADKHAAFELDVVKHYAPEDRLQQMEHKFTLAIDKLINRFDAFAADFHKVVGRMERARGDPGGP